MNYFIIVASFLNFLMGCSAAFVELFRKYTFSPAGQNGNVYAPPPASDLLGRIHFGARTVLFGSMVSKATAIEKSAFKCARVLAIGR